MKLSTKIAGVVAAGALALTAAFTAIGSPPAPAPTPKPAAVAAGAGVTGVSHVLLVMLENKAYTATVGHMPYLDSLRTSFGQATNYWATNYPSLPNYIALTSGVVPSNIAGKDCLPSGSCVTGVASIFGQTSWRVFAESMPSNCYRSNTSLYAPRHTAAPYYTQVATACKSDQVPLTALPGALSNGLPAFSLIAPNLCNDGHGGGSSGCSAGVSKPDAWLKTWIPKIMAGVDYKAGHTLIEVTFDSGSNNCGSSCASHVELVLVNPNIHKSLTQKYTHYSLLRLNEELLGVSLLGQAGSAANMLSESGL